MEFRRHQPGSPTQVLDLAKDANPSLTSINFEQYEGVRSNVSLQEPCKGRGFTDDDPITQLLEGTFDFPLPLALVCFRKYLHNIGQCSPSLGDP